MLHLIPVMPQTPLPGGITYNSCKASKYMVMLLRSLALRIKHLKVLALRMNLKCNFDKTKHIPRTSTPFRNLKQCISNAFKINRFLQNFKQSFLGVYGHHPKCCQRQQLQSGMYIIIMNSSNNPHIT